MISFRLFALCSCQAVGAVGHDFDERFNLAVAPDGDFLESSATAAGARLFRSPDGSLVRSQRTNAKPTALEAKSNILRSHPAYPEDAQSIAEAVKEGVQAFTKAVEFFKMEGPTVEEGLRSLGMRLLHVVDPWVQAELDQQMHNAFSVKWQAHVSEFLRASNGHVLETSIRAFRDSGDTSKLVEAVVKALSSIGVDVCSELPQSLGEELSRYLLAVTDTCASIGTAWAYLETGEAADGLEALWRNISSAVDPMIPDNLKTDATYETILVELDHTIEELTESVMVAAKTKAEDSCCWKDYEARPRQRPNKCPSNHKYDGDYWCYKHFAEDECEKSWAEGQKCSDRIERVHQDLGGTDEAKTEATNRVVIEFKPACDACGETDDSTTSGTLLQRAMQACDSMPAGVQTCGDRLRSKYKDQPGKSARELIDEVVVTDNVAECEVCHQNWLLLERSHAVSLEESLQSKHRHGNNSSDDSDSSESKDMDNTLHDKHGEKKGSDRRASDRDNEAAECESQSFHLINNWCYDACHKREDVEQEVMCTTSCKDTTRFTKEAGTALCATTEATAQQCENNMAMTSKTSILTAEYLYTELDKRGIKDANTHIPQIVAKFVALGKAYEHKYCHEALRATAPPSEGTAVEDAAAEEATKKAEEALKADDSKDDPDE